MAQPVLTVKVDGNFRNLQKALNVLSEQGLDVATNELANQAIDIMTRSVRSYMPASHRLAKKNPHAQQRTVLTSTGKMWSGWGERKTVIHTNEHLYIRPTFPSDNYTNITKTNNKNAIRYKIEVGTHVDYAEHVDQGRPARHTGRRTYDFKKLGMQQASKEVSKLSKVMLENAVGQLNASQRTSLRRRNVRGKFEKESDNSLFRFATKGKIK